jgi:hypothetical protein
MAFAYPAQKIQDWLTQQWVISFGKKIEPAEYTWLMGPFGELNGIGEDYIHQLAKKENLVIERETSSKGLMSSIDLLNLPKNIVPHLSKDVIGFYENTSNYDLCFTVKWNPFFRMCGRLINKLFSQRINQLNIPTKNIKINESITSEIISLFDPKTNQIKYTIWLRIIKKTSQIIYSGVYSICNLPSGKACIKAVFPLPKGNATVIMLPSVGEKGELILNSSGKRFGEAGFYFLLNDSKNNFWAKYLRSFRDQLIISSDNTNILAIQKLTLWNLKVLEFKYEIKLRN